MPLSHKEAMKALLNGKRLVMPSGNYAYMIGDDVMICQRSSDVLSKTSKAQFLLGAEIHEYDQVDFEKAIELLQRGAMMKSLASNKYFRIGSTSIDDMEFSYAEIKGKWVQE